MKIYKYFLFIPLIIFIASCSNNISIDKNISDIHKRLDNYLSKHLQEESFPGIQYVIFDSEKLQHKFSGGMAQIDTKKKMHSYSVLNVFSTTKIITAIAILQLAQDGQLSLDDKLVKHFPTIPYKNVTIRHVLSHSSGIPDPFIGNYYIHWSDEHASYDSDALLTSVLKENDTLKFNPGEEISYSNLGYAILGKIIENISGLRYETYVTKNIFNKLNLNPKEIGFGDQTQLNASKPYFKRMSILFNLLSMLLDNNKTKVEGNWKSIDKPFYFDFPAHGGIVASAREYSKIFMDLLKNKSVLLSAKSKKILFTIQKQYKKNKLAIGWFKGKMNDIPYFFHQGGGLGYIAEVRIYPTKSIGSLILINKSDGNSLSILSELDTEYITQIK